MVTERDAPLALMVQAPDEPGALHALTGVFLDHEANITHVDIVERREGFSTVYFELEDVAGEAADALIGDLEALPIVRAAERAPSFQKVYGKRIIVVGGGAQVGQVVVGAVAEADRHNIRGEKISVDTIPLVGEEELAAASSSSPTRGMVSTEIFSPRMLCLSASATAPTTTCPTCAPPPTTMIRFPYTFWNEGARSAALTMGRALRSPMSTFAPSSVTCSSSK